VRSSRRQRFFSILRPVSLFLFFFCFFVFVFFFVTVRREKMRDWKRLKFTEFLLPIRYPVWNKWICESVMQIFVIC
jgi:hypothetical protein